MLNLNHIHSCHFVIFLGVFVWGFCPGVISGGCPGGFCPGITQNEYKMNKVLTVILANTVPTERIKVLGSLSKTLVGDHQAHEVNKTKIVIKGTNGI